MPPKRPPKGKAQGRAGAEKDEEADQTSAGPSTRTLVTKPSHVKETVGTGGREVKVITNYFRLNTPKEVVHNYHVTFEPQIESKRVRSALLYSQADQLHGAFVFDGMSDLKSVEVIEGPNLFLTATRQHDGTRVTIRLEKSGTVPYGAPEMLRLYNTQTRRNLTHIGMSLVGRNFFDKQPIGNVEDRRYGGVTILQGANTAINNHDGGLMMMVDITFKFLRKKNALQLLNEIRGQHGDDWLRVARQQVAGQIVMTQYNYKTYRIDNIDSEKRPSDTFERNNRGPVSYIDYYKEQYPGVTIREPRQPMLVVMPSTRDKRAGRTDPIYLVPELCTLTGVTDDMRKDFNFMKQINTHSKLAPQERVKKLQTFMGRVRSNPRVTEEMNKWNIRYEERPVVVDARVLDKEKLIMSGAAGAKEGPVIQKADFARDMRNQKLPVAPTVNSIAFIVLKNDKPSFDKIGRPMVDVCTQIGFRAFPTRPHLIIIDNDRINDWRNAIDQVPKISNMIVFIVPNNKKERYDALKQICCIDKGIPSQVIVTRTLQKDERVMSVVTKIIIQMACKLGGEAWRIVIPPQGLMICGFDVYHDSSRRGRSAGAFVSTTSTSYNQYYSQVNYHESREELSTHFRENITQGIEAFRDKNKAMPRNLIIYRDGVGEGNIRYVFEIELEQIKLALANLTKGQEPIKLTFIIVSKRVNARFFLGSPNNRFDNCEPGTVVDNQVTRPERYDFYLISQSVREGTVTPTMYDIIFDETAWSPFRQQTLAYKLCHMYFNWQGTVKVPAPCQYAHRLAYLAGQSLHKQANAGLTSTLYYL
ncbi:piwi-like protein Siwi [Brevipalpus obovatus]|uniref:piwi-like protein Siwi n=1 Tax=Brevipalpus obovatus TaxID=246614 RepID=UPI003D9EA998